MVMQLESPRRSSSSPEFEFWMVGNAHPDLQPHLLTADELFVDGVLLPLHLLSVAPESTPLGLDPETILKSDPYLDAEKRSKPPPSSSTEEEEEEAAVVVAPAAAAAPIHPEASICSSTAPSISSSKRWKDIFKVGGGEKKKESRERDKKKERKSSNGTGGGAAELNINIWPFSRSRSAGTASGVRPKEEAAAAAMRKSSSAPCSRSNSRGESAGGRRWAASPGRPGVPVGRASPVWQARRGAGAGRAGATGEKGRKRVGLNGGGVRGLNLNVNSCIGYRNQASCRGEERERVGVDNNANNNGGLFRFRALFSKKVY